MDNLDQFACHTSIVRQITRFAIFGIACSVGGNSGISAFLCMSPGETARILHSHFGNAGWSNLDAARKAGMKRISHLLRRRCQLSTSE